MQTHTCNVLQTRVQWREIKTFIQSVILTTAELIKLSHAIMLFLLIKDTVYTFLFKILKLMIYGHYMCWLPKHEMYSLTYTLSVQSILLKSILYFQRMFKNIKNVLFIMYNCVLLFVLVENSTSQKD